MEVKYIKAGEENLESPIPLFKRSTDRGEKDEEYLFVPVRKYIKVIREHKKAEEKLRRARKELGEEKTLRKYVESRYESLLAEYPSKGEKKRVIKIEIAFPVKSWERGLARYGTEEIGMEIKTPIAGVGRDMYSLLLSAAMPHDIGHVPFSLEQEAKASMLQELSPQYILVDRCSKFVFAPIAALALILSVIFYLSTNIGMGVGLLGIGITSLLLTIVFSVTKSSLKG